MKFQLPPLKLVGKMAVTLLALIALGLLLLVLVYTIPTDRIKEHITESANTFYEEGPYPHLDNTTSTLDSFTDALMLLTAAYDGPEGAFRKALESNHIMVTALWDSSPEFSLMIHFVIDPNAEIMKVPYARYWHGYQILLKPLLTVFNYGQIRTINCLLQFLLAAVIVVFMCIKKCIKAVPAFIISILMIHPFACAMSLQYSSVVYIILIFSLLLLIFSEKLTTSKDAIYLFFLILGAATSYIDLLTFPTAAFCMVAVMYVCLQHDNILAVDFRNILNLLICWLIGYGVMFASKWVLATWFTEYDIVQDALTAIQSRAGNVVAGQEVTAIQTLKNTFSAYFNTPYVIAAAIILGIEIIVLLVSKAKFRWDLAVSYLLILIMPIIWYICVKNHSFMHSFFTNKSLAGSMFALLCIFIAWNIPSKHDRCSSKKESPKNRNDTMEY